MKRPYRYGARRLLTNRGAAVEGVLILQRPQFDTGLPLALVDANITACQFTDRTGHFSPMGPINELHRCPSHEWSQGVYPALPSSRLRVFYRDVGSALLHLVNQWLNFSYSRSLAFRYGNKKKNPLLLGLEFIIPTERAYVVPTGPRGRRTVDWSNICQQKAHTSDILEH